MNNHLLAQNPFGVLTFIVAPAILTNATSVLAMSTINRMLRTRDRMHELLKESADPAVSRGAKFVDIANRVEQQALLLLRALHWIYVVWARSHRRRWGDAARICRRGGIDWRLREPASRLRTSAD